MGCLRLSYRTEESNLSVSTEEKTYALNWQVWVGGKGEKETKELEDQTNGGGGYQVTDLGPFTGSLAPGLDFFEGVRVFSSEVGDLEYGAAFTLPGLGIFVNPNDVTNEDLLRHEFGHILQAQKWGNDFFYNTIVPQSLISASHNTDHQSSWTEWTANLLSWRYFGKPADWDMNTYRIYPRGGDYPPKHLNLKY
jgi:hypothetical protein